MYFFGDLTLNIKNIMCQTVILLSSFYNVSFTQRGHLLGPVTGIPVEFDLDRTPRV